MLVQFAAKARGTSHIEKGLPCQDAADADLCLNNTIGIACVADGHGGSKYFRSDKGADFAVEVSKQSLSKYYETLANDHENEKKAAFFNRKANDEIEDSLKQLEGNIIYNWRNAVLQDLKENPLIEDEIRICNANNIAIDNPSDLIFIYGTTLLAALVSDNFWFIIQIGDGLSVVIENEENITIPIAEDERLAFGRTTSLCDNDALQNFREGYGFTAIQGLTLGTDGIADSFEREKYLRFNKELYDKFTHIPPAQAEAELRVFLPELSERGSRDDVAIAGIFRKEVIKNIKFKTFKEFFDDISPIHNSKYDLSGFIFRGESSNSKNRKLLPGALRDKKDDEQVQQIFNEINDLCEFYKEANFNSLVIPKNKFIPAYSPDEIMEKMGNTIFWLSGEFEEIASLAQHYGIPTRLLDWTRDIFTAFYFASTGVYFTSNGEEKSAIDKNESMIIYAINYKYLAKQINKWRHFETRIDYEPMPIKFVVPHYADNANITAQSGILSYSEIKICSYNENSWKADFMPLDEKLQNLADGKYSCYTLENPDVLLYKFEIPVTEAVKMYSFISRFNYSYSKMFPGYSGITRTMKEKNFFKEKS